VDFPEPEGAEMMNTDVMRSVGDRSSSAETGETSDSLLKVQSLLAYSLDISLCRQA